MGIFNGGRSSLGGHVAGTGMESSWEEMSETWENKRESVRFNNDPQGKETLEEIQERMSGEVVTYFVKGTK